MPDAPFFPIPSLDAAVDARSEWTGDPRHEVAFRLFNGFLEGDPEVVIDVYARTLLLQNYADAPAGAAARIAAAQDWLLQRLPWLQTVVLKEKASADAQARNGKVVFGGPPDRRVRENGVWYAIDLTLNQDASLYLDTRNLRAWAKETLGGKKALNTFAYTGSFGVAALAGGARQVLQMDRTARFLNLAKESCILNGFPVRKADFLSGDFWVLVNRLKRAGELFDCVFVDPPYFSETRAGRVDLVAESARVINKVRPLVGHGGKLVAINNALFLPGIDFARMLAGLCADGYLSIETFIPAPPDFTGYPQTRHGALPVDPAPFNHSTKIVVLGVKRKDERSAQ